MRKTILFAALTAAAVLPFAGEADARAVCKERDAIISVLNKRFGETQRSFGLQSDRRVLEIYASEKGSWTALLTLPDGQSCVVATGEAWNSLPPPPVGEPA
jgi:hypothetical protein